MTITISDQTQPSDCIAKVLLWGIFYIGLFTVITIFLLQDNFFETFRPGDMWVAQQNGITNMVGIQSTSTKRPFNFIQA